MPVESAAGLVERLTKEGLESLRDDVAHGRRNTGLKSLDERGAMSEIVRDQYTGRYPLELIQNANDAEASEGSTGSGVKFVVTDTALLVADQGAGFGSTPTAIADTSDLQPTECAASENAKTLKFEQADFEER